jgi:hypothetical protein
MTTALASPTYHDLIGLLANERRLLERLLFRHAEISMLVAAGEHRFVGKAIDEAIEVENELAGCDLMRAMVTSALADGGQDLSISELIATAPDEIKPQLESTAKEMKRLMTQVDRYRAEAAAWAGERAGQLRGAIERFGADTY